MTRTVLSRSLALVAASVLSAACATTRYTQSRVESVPAGVKGKPGRSASIEIEGVKIRIETLDRVPRTEEAQALAVRLFFEPRELGYSFDPGQVLLRGADGRESRPAASGYQPLFPGASAHLDFDTAVEAGKPMELVLGGLYRGTKPLEPVTLRLARGEGRSYDRLYWLEAIGYVIMAPLALAGGGM